MPVGVCGGVCAFNGCVPVTARISGKRTDRIAVVALLERFMAYASGFRFGCDAAAIHCIERMSKSVRGFPGAIKLTQIA
jgi:hypothetical protein